MKKFERFIELDVWRGVAIIGMVLFHFFFILDYIGSTEMEYQQGLLNILARSVQLSFLLLIGISLHLASQKSKLSPSERSQFYPKQWKRGVVVFLFGLLITLITGIFIPEDFVRFGILHFIGISILLLSWFADKPRTALLLGLIVFVSSLVIQQYPTNIEILLVLGFPYPFQSLDYFPLFPWLTAPALGIFLGSMFYHDYERRWSVMNMKSSPLINFLAMLGKHALLIYLIHIPILLGILSAWKIAF